MQLILNSEDIDINRKMSTIEHESLSEKFPDNDKAESIAEDITSGNKENIHKRENIIPFVEEDVVDPSKDVNVSNELILNTNLNRVVSNGDECVTEVEKTFEKNLCVSNDDNTDQNTESEDLANISEGITEVDKSFEKNVCVSNVDNTDQNTESENLANISEGITEVEKTFDKKLCVSNDNNTDQNTDSEDLANICEDQTPGKDNSLRLEDIELSNVTVEKSQENSIMPETIDSHPTLNEPSANENESKLAILTKPQNNLNIRSNDKNITLHDKLDGDFKIKTTVVSDRNNKDKLDGDKTNVSYMSKQEETDVNVNICVSNASNELNKQCEIEVDKEIDIADLCSELKEENKIDEDDNVDNVSEKPSNKETYQSVIPNNEVDKNEIIECDVVESPNLNNTCDTAIELDDEDSKLVTSTEESSQKVKGSQDKAEVIKTIDEIDSSTSADTKTPEVVEKQIATIQKAAEEPIPPKRICRLSNNLDIFSDEEDEVEPPKDIQPAPEKQCINIDDDDDIMLVDEDSNTKNCKPKDNSTNDGSNTVSKESTKVPDTSTKNEDVCMGNEEVTEAVKESHPVEKDVVHISEPAKDICSAPASDSSKPAVEKPTVPEPPRKPLLPNNFVNTCKKNLADMTRDDLEEFCILKIVESVVDRSNLGEIKAQLKLLTQTMEECKKKCLMLSKQNKDLQVVLKSVQEEQKSGSDHHITPLKITRSVGMQVVMVADRNNQRKKSLPVNGVGLSPANVANPATKPTKAQQQNTKNQKEKASSNPIPKPRLVPAAPVAKPTTQPSPKQLPNVPNGVRNSPPVQKAAEKRPRAQSVTVDLTDDEPPAKQPAGPRGVTPQAMRFAPPQPKTVNVPPTQRFGSVVNSPRKVYIPIGGPQAQNNMGNRTLMLKPMAAMGPRAVASGIMTKGPRGPVPMARVQNYRHPAPLPDAMKQYQPPNWKLLPPAPDLKLSKVENGIVISWKIDGYLVDNHEEIASYQLYAYQETTSPPSTALWKKIGDVKALPLPMACTLTQFMAGFKYYFAVRAVDIRSRFGPFSLPGSILLLNKI